MYVVVSNEAHACVHGLFATVRDAQAWAHKHLVGFCWRVQMLQTVA